jgi:uncharacterized caspase-like protein
MPVGSDRVKREDEVPYKAVDVQQVLDKMETARNRINVVILDACRDNPFARSSRSGGGGLSQMDAPIGSVVAFATAPGSVASDGKGSNGLYTQHLLANIERPGMPMEEVFKRVRLGVRLDSNGQQVPWEKHLAGRRLLCSLRRRSPAKSGPTVLPAAARRGADRTRRARLRTAAPGKLDDAERIFRALAGSSHPEVAWMGREGLAELQLARGDPQAALNEANQIIASAPTRSAAYLIRGRALSATGQGKAGQDDLQLAASAAHLGRLRLAEVQCAGGGGQSCSASPTRRPRSRATSARLARTASRWTR